MNKYIQTVTGLVNVEEIKVTDSHSHLYALATKEIQEKTQDLVLDNIENLKEDLEIFKQLDGNLIAEMTTMDYGRDLEKLKKISQDNNVYVIATAGYNKGAYNREFLEFAEISDVTKNLVKEIQENSIKPGLLKVGTSLNEIYPWEEKGLRAISRATLQTGVPISTHTEKGTMAREQVKIFEEEKVPYENIIICHLDQLDDYNCHKELLEKGIFLSYDSIAKTKYQTRDRALKYITEFAKIGLHKNILVGNDFARKSSLIGYGGGPGYTSVFKEFKKELSDILFDNGFNLDEVNNIINDIYIQNPRRAFAIKKNQS